jgi:hypothetical protein
VIVADAVIVHRIPGRVRLRIVEKRGDAAYFTELAVGLSRLGNVESAKANPATASVAMEFTGALDDLLQQARDEGLLSGIDSGNRVGGAGATSPRRPGNPVRLVSGRDINRMFVIGSALLLVGVAQIIRKDVLPPAVTAFWYAMEAFGKAQKTR